MESNRKPIIIKIWTAVLLALCAHSFLFAQNRIQGVVTDSRGEPVVGATVLLEKSSTGTSTDANGKYAILAEPGDELVFSCIGFKMQKAPAPGNGRLDIVMADDLTMLDETVVVGYGTQKRQNLTGAVSAVAGEELLKAPAQTINNMLGGVVPGIVSYQSSGQPGVDAASLLVRGGGVKVIVDGAERDLSHLDPTEIESLSVLKDASAAAIYGMDAQSVIIVTTKRGQNKSSRISYHGAFTLSQNAQMLELLDAPGYAYWYNLARQMDGNDPIFSAEMVAKMKTGRDGWGNTDWYKDTFGLGYNQNHTISASGGTDKMTWFTSLNYYDQQGNVRGYAYNRINVRANIDARIAKNLNFGFNLAGRFSRTARPYWSADPDDWMNIGQQAMRAHPYVPKTYDGYVVSTRTASALVSPEGAMQDSGSYTAHGNVMETTFKLQWDVPWIKGLAVKSLAAFDIGTTTTKSVNVPYLTMYAVRPTSIDGDISYALSYGANGSTSSVVEGLSRYAQLLTNFSLEYGGEFGKNRIHALALLETKGIDSNRFGAYGYDLLTTDLPELDFTQDKTKDAVSGGSGHRRYAGLVGRVNYAWDNKYLAELSCRYDGSYLFSGSTPGARWAPFPAASLGWRIDRENWFSAPAVDMLKFRVGADLTGSSSGVDPYVYLNTMSGMTNTAVIGGKPVSSIFTSAPANVHLTWAKAFQTNVGADLTMWGGLLRVEADLFYKYVYDIVRSVSNDFPASWGGFFFKEENGNKQDHKGFELLLEHRHRIGDWSWRVALSGTYTYRRWLCYNDPVNYPDYLKLTGKEVGSQVGFIALGLFQSQEEIANSATIPGVSARPGDIRYLDRNGDGIISYDQDRGYVAGSAYPRFQGGLSANLSWKGLDFSMNWVTGLFRTLALTGVYSSGVMDNTSMTKPFYHDGNAPFYLVENSWTETHTDARFPRLSISSPSGNNNGYSSTWWYENGNYLRLKSAQIGYSLPRRWMEKLRVQQARLFMEGTNLLTFSKLAKYHIDPETPGVSNGYYPQQRLFGIGLDVTF